jgi:serine/threonine protein kinase
VQIYEVHENLGYPCFSLELMEGGSLDKKLGGTPQPPREAARLVEVLARAIHVAHQNGIVHRDLKPGNILLDAGYEPGGVGAWRLAGCRGLSINRAEVHERLVTLSRGFTVLAGFSAETLL